MTPIDVFFVARNPEFITRGYYDCAFLESILDDAHPTPRKQFSFTHHDVREMFPHHDGAVVAFSGMGCADDADWLIDQIEQMPWVLVIIMGNEIWDFPWRRLPETDRRKVWVMNPLPEHAELSNRIPGGPYPHTREEIAPHWERAALRPLDWFFGGQVTNIRRKQCLSALRELRNGELITTDRFLGGVPSSEYNRILAGAKIVPCPSGPMTLDANRPLAAMEAGCVPILDMIKPSDPQFDYWQLVFGEHPIPTIDNWEMLTQKTMDMYLRDWPHLSNKVFAWWQQWKRSTALKLHADLREVIGVQLEPHPVGADDRITAVVTTSPITSHPDTSIIEQTIASIREQLPTAEIIVAFDGVRPEQQWLKALYEEYVRRILWKCNYEWTNVLPVIMPEWGHQANTTRLALQFVETETMLFVEHDTPILGEIPWDDLIGLIEDGHLNVLRLHQDVAIHPDHEQIMLDRKPQIINGVPIRRTKAYWQRPHLASTEFYRETIIGNIREDSRTMIEEPTYSAMFIDCTDHRRTDWDRWKVAIYSPPGDIRRSGHFDGRGEEPKYRMWDKPEEDE